MLDNNWELINGPVAHRIELLNAANQTNVLNGLIMFLLEHKGPFGTGMPPMPDEAALISLHQASTLFLLAEPGSYRNIGVHVGDQKGTIVFQPMDWQDVPGAVRTFFRHLSSMWQTSDPIAIAAYALWHINWIHPFRNGNGRTARAFAYACLTLKVGNFIAGTITIIDLLQQKKKPDLEAALRVADSARQLTGIPDLSVLQQLLLVCLSEQLQSAAPNVATSP